MLRNRNLVAVSAVVCTSFVGIGMVVPVRVLYAQSRGASLAIIGAMASSYLLSSVLFQYPTGWLADMWGRRRVMLVGLCAQAVLSLLYLAVTDPIVFIVLRFLEGIFAACVIPAARAIIIDSVPEKERGQAFGLFGSALSAGFLLGPAIGGAMAAFGYSSAFIGSSVLRVAAVAIVLFFIRAEGKVHPDTRARARAVPTRALFTLPLVGIYILFFGNEVFFGFDLTLMPIWMRHDLHAPVAVIGLAYAMWALPNMIVLPFGGRLADRTRHSTLILGAGLAQVPIYAALGLMTTAAPVVTIFFVHGIIYALMQPAVDAHLAASSPRDARARTQALYTAIGTGSAFIFANVLPGIYTISFRLPLFAMALIFGVCVAIGGGIVRVSERRKSIPVMNARPLAREA